MNEMLNRDGACSNLRIESRFETADLDFPGENPFPSQFCGKLRKVFEIPTAHSEPENIRLLLRQIEALFDVKR